MEETNICSIVRKNESEYVSTTTKLGRYVEFSLYETVEKTDAYLYSQHTSGKTDSLNREKPFFNIGIAARNIWYRATDIDRKNIKLKTSQSKKVIETLLANVHLQYWMRKINFGTFLNDWGRSLATYGSSMIKFVEKDGTLFCSVIPWNRLIVDSVDVNNDVKIEILEYTPAQLRKNKSYDQKVVKDLLSSVSARENLDKTKKDTKNNFIRVYEVHGELPLSLITDDENDSETYVQQMHVVSFVAKEGKNDEYDDYTLYKGREEKDPYMITHLIKEDGRAIGIGAIEHLFEAQWMVNYSAKAIKDQLDLASKLIFQTADSSYVGKNVLTDLETGDILTYNLANGGSALAPVNNQSHDISSLMNWSNQWKALSQEITSTPDSLMGNTAPPGTAWRQVEALQQEAHSLFEVMTENKGLAIEDMMRRHVIQYIAKQMDTAEEISATLSDADITQIDSIYIPNKAIRTVNKMAIDRAINGDPMTAEAQAQEIQNQMQGIKQSLASSGNQRFFKPDEVSSKTWRELFKGLVWDVDVDVTHENRDSDAILTTLNSVLQTIANPATAAVLQTPQGKFIFNRIMSEVGDISPVELSTMAAAPAMPVTTGKA
jgi:hypothetical protein